jgi:hypothetical protein
MCMHMLHMCICMCMCMYAHLHMHGHTCTSTSTCADYVQGPRSCCAREQALPPLGLNIPLRSEIRQGFSESGLRNRCSLSYVSRYLRFQCFSRGGPFGYNLGKSTENVNILENRTLTPSSFFACSPLICRWTAVHPRASRRGLGRPAYLHKMSTNTTWGRVVCINYPRAHAHTHNIRCSTSVQRRGPSWLRP